MSDTFGNELVALLPRLRRFALSLSGARDRADDLVQTACEKALASAASWTPGTRFDAWMFRILRNAWIDTFRRAKIENIAGEIGDFPEIAGTDGVADTEARMTLAAVLAAMGELPPEQREVLVLTCVEDFSYGEAAEMLGVPIGTVMSRLARAREKIAVRAGIERKPKR